MENNLESAEKFCKSKSVKIKKFKDVWYSLLDKIVQ